MGKDWKKPRKDWRPRVFSGAPLIPTERVKDIQALRGLSKPDPFQMMVRGGLHHGDHLLFSWIVGVGGRFDGCRIAAYQNQGKTLLKWAPAGWLREPSGEYLYAPYLTSLGAVYDFIHMLTTVCGYGAKILDEENTTCKRVVLEEVVGESRRLIPGDHLSFNQEKKEFHVERSQSTLDMNLYHPPMGMMTFGVGYISLPHHPLVIIRVATEANGRMAQSLGNDEFLVV